ncbi:sensor histidine kinase [Kribbella ginsengisoli]|uniref:histidine kinase n=1 Tax=Kribbella ginsengisoli TaxID=363865 RepID=A0ABP6XFE9_9ACTN
MQDIGLAVVDTIVGTTLAGLGLAAASKRPRATGLLMTATAIAWFAGNLGGLALFLHRGPLVHLLLSYPRGWPRRWPTRVVIALAYVDALVSPVGRANGVTVALASVVIGAALIEYGKAPHRERRARGLAAAATVGIMLVLGVGAGARLIGSSIDTTVLWAYELVVGAAAVVLFVGIRPAHAAITGLVVDLGEPERAGVLADKLGQALGDPSLVLGYWLPETGGYVDEAGRPVALPDGDPTRVQTPLVADGQHIGVLVHDAAVLDDPQLVESVVSLARMAATNVRLQAEVRARVGEVEAARRRIVEAADAERRRLEGLLQKGAMQRLSEVSGLLTADDPAELRAHLDSSQVLLREFARGIHPRVLTESGLAVALAELAGTCLTPVELEVMTARLPAAVEATAYFVCSEALANIGKYAQAGRARIEVALTDGEVVVKVTDDGVGGADPARGTGLRGLTDRVHALGGTFQVESRPGAGTRLTVQMPSADPPPRLDQEGRRSRTE